MEMLIAVNVLCWHVHDYRQHFLWEKLETTSTINLMFPDMKTGWVCFHWRINIWNIRKYSYVWPTKTHMYSRCMSVYKCGRHMRQIIWVWSFKYSGNKKGKTEWFFCNNVNHITQRRIIGSYICNGKCTETRIINDHSKV